MAFDIHFVTDFFNRLSAVLDRTKRYNITFDVRNTPDQVVSACAEISFRNQGEATVIIQSAAILLPGEFISLDGKQNEKDTTNYRIGFINTGSQLQSCLVVRKYYIT